MSKDFKSNSKAALFLELAKPNKDGFSRRVYVSEFAGKYAELKMGNGGAWCRESSRLASIYNVERGKKGVPIHYVRLHGFKKIPIKKPIPARIRKALKDKRCVVLGVSQVEIDHKDGRLDDPRLSDPKRLKVDDFQPLSKAANNAKRQHCKRCRETDRRFDARTIGYAVGQCQGNGAYRGSCVGCYWYDPVAFNKAMSRATKSKK